ncbi:MAG: SWF/SNF helicase family protein, partial [Paeniclostridium sp.]
EYNYLDGQTTAKDRIKLVNEFNENNNKKVFLISLKAGGTGLNLTSANTVIHFDPWWNISVENQASDRAHRLGQKQVVEVIKLIAKGTIEEKIIKLQEEKIKLIDDIISNELSDSATLKSLSNDEILDLLK